MNTTRTTLAVLLAAIATAAAQETAPAAPVPPVQPTTREGAVFAGGDGEDTIFIAADSAQVANPVRWQFRAGADDQTMPLSPREGPIGYLGISTVLPGPEVAAQLPIPPDTGLVVAAVRPDSAAAKTGLERNDVLVRLDDQILIHPRQFSVLVANHKPGDTVKLALLRKGKLQEFTAALDKREQPKNPPAEDRTLFLAHREGEAGPTITIDGQPVDPIRTLTRRLQVGEDVELQLREIRGRVDQLAKQRLDLHSPLEPGKPAVDPEARIREMQQRIEALTRELAEKEKK